jgi:hypothetical protein
MKRFVCALVLGSMLVVAGCGGAAAEDTTKMKAALDAASRLKSKVEAGVVYADYTTSVGNAKGEVDLFAESPAAKSHPEVATALARAMRAYVGASEIWNAKIQLDGTPYASGIGSWDSLVSEFPALSDSVTDRGNTNAVTGEYERVPAVKADAAIHALWTAASESISTAKTAASK